MRERTMLKITAHKNPPTVNPLISWLAYQINTPFTIKEKSPSVIRLIGRVKKPIIGLMNVLITAKTTATTRAVKKLSILTFGRIYAVIATARAFTRSLTKSFIQV